MQQGQSIMSKKSIVVVGSSNTDMVLQLDRIPRPGETILGGQFVMAAGGKGANQAVAAARAGGNVTFVARVGRDMFGDKALAGFAKDGICVDHIVRDKKSSFRRGIDLRCSQRREQYRGRLRGQRRP